MWDHLKKASRFVDFEELLADALIEQFRLLGGKPEEAARSAAKYKNAQDWIAYHKTQTVAAGVGSGLIPGASFALMSADMAFLLHKLAYMSWGIGTIYGCKVYSKPDFLHILQIWGENETRQGDMMAVSYPFVKAVNAIMAIQSMMKLENLTEAKELAVYNELGKLYAATGKLEHAIAHWGDRDGAHGVKLNIARKKLVKVGAKLSQKMAKKLATKIASKVAAKFVLGIVPIIGAATSGYVNHWMMDGIAHSAIQYYARAIRV